MKFCPIQQAFFYDSCFKKINDFYVAIKRIGGFDIINCEDMLNLCIKVEGSKNVFITETMSEFQHD